MAMEQERAKDDGEGRKMLIIFIDESVGQKGNIRSVPDIPIYMYWHAVWCMHYCNTKTQCLFM